MNITAPKSMESTQIIEKFSGYVPEGKYCIYFCRVEVARNSNNDSNINGYGNNYSNDNSNNG